MTANSCKTAEIHELVKCLIEDPHLLHRWFEFSVMLKSDPQDLVRWEMDIRSGICSHYQVFSNCLIKWLSRNLQTTVQDLCEILQNMKCIAVVEQLQANFRMDDVIQFSGNQPTETAGHSKPETKQDDSNVKKEFKTSGKYIKWPITHNLLLSISNYVGREKELEQLKTQFNSNTNLILICGFGGIGKTELCKKFLKDIPSLCTTPVNRIWLHGDTLESLRDSILKLAGELGISNKSKPPPSPSEYFEYLADVILDSFPLCRLLVVIDNIDVKYDEVVNVIKLIQKDKNKRMFVIVTSRDSTVLNNARFTMKLDVLEENQARILLQKSMPDLEDSDANKLSNLLQNFPLALHQAVAYIKQQRNNFRTPNYSVSNYVDEFEEKKAKMLDQKLNEFEYDYSLTTLITWDMTFCKMTENAVEILKILSYLYLEPYKISVDFLESIYKNKHAQAEDFDEGLNLIYKYSLVKIEFVFLSIHRLIQEVMRQKIIDSEYGKTLFDIVFFTCMRIDKSKDSITDPINLLSRVGKLAWSEKSNFMTLTSLQDALSTYKDLISFPLYKQEDNPPSKLIKYARNLGPSENYETLIFNQFFCTIYRLQPYHNCPNQIHSLRRMEILAEMQHFQGEFKKALDSFHELLKYFEETGDKCKITQCKSKIFELTLESLVTELGDKIPREQWEMIGYGDYSNFILPGLEKLLPLYKKIFRDSDNHFYTVQVKNSIAKQLLNYDRPRCISLCNEVLDSNVDGGYSQACEILLKAEFYNLKNVTDPLESLPVSEYIWDRYTREAIFLQEHFKRKKLNLGKNHSNTIRMLALLAETHETFGKLELALELYEHVRDSSPILYSWRDEDLKLVRLKVARVKLKLGDFTGLIDVQSDFSDYNSFEIFSEGELYKILSFYKGRLGENHELTVRVKTAIALKLISSCNYERSLTFVEEIIMSGEVGDEITAAYNIMEEISGLFEVYDDFNKSRELFERVLVFRKSSLGESHVKTIETKRLLAETLEKLGEFSKALELHTERLNYYEHVPKEEGLRQLYNLEICEIIKKQMEQLNSKIASL